MLAYAFFETAQDGLTCCLKMARVTSLFVTMCVLFVSLQGEEETKETDDEIIGGVNANPGDIPYQVGLAINLLVNCGGAIIDEYHILTAAHCSRIWKYYSVIVGSVDMTWTKDPNRFTTEIDHIYVHSGFNVDKNEDNDIAIARIKGKFTWTNFVKPITMAKGVPPSGTLCEISGWGWTNPNDTSNTTILQKVNVPIADRKKCEELYKPLNETIYPSTFCAGFEEDKKAACRGDSGGPLTCDGLLVGIVSRGQGCPEPNYFGIYVDVSAYKSWIESTLNESYSELGVPNPHYSREI